MQRLKLALLTLIACSSHVCADDAKAPADKSHPVVKVQDIAKGYKRLNSMTKEPVFVDEDLALLCRHVQQVEVEEARKFNGPHAHTTIVIYMNGSAAEAFQKRARAYPVGAVIVKEKTGMPYDIQDSKGQKTRTQTRDGVGGMIKRAQGYDPDHGDWEYFYFENAAKIESGKIASCIRCHEGAARTDRVFGDWARAEEQRTGKSDKAATKAATP